MKTVFPPRIPVLLGAVILLSSQVAILAQTQAVHGGVTAVRAGPYAWTVYGVVALVGFIVYSVRQRARNREAARSDEEPSGRIEPAKPDHIA